MAAWEPFQTDYRAFRALEQGLKPLKQELRRHAQTHGQSVPTDLLRQTQVLLAEIHETHEEVRQSTPAEYWIPDPWIRQRLVGKSLLDIVGDRDLLAVLGRQWSEGAGQGPHVRDALSSDHGYSRLVASETRLLVELGLSFNEASAIVRRTWSANVAKRSRGADPYQLMMSRSGPHTLLGVSTFSLGWFAASLAVKMQVLLTEDPDEPTWIRRVRQVMEGARARSALAVVQSADTYIEPVGDPLTVFLTCVEIALESADGNLEGVASLVGGVIAGLVDVTIPDETM